MGPWGMPNGYSGRNDLQDPSWRTRELGPDLRRQLFEKLVPSAGGKTGDRPGATGKEPKQSDKDKKQTRKKKGRHPGPPR
jgi:hypothetical protein